MKTASINKGQFRSLATRLSLWIVPLGALILTTVLGTNYFLSRFLLEDYIDDIARQTTSSTVKEIETIFHSVSTNANSMAAVVYELGITEKQIHQTIKAFIKTDADIYGMTVALEPHTLIESIGDFSPYYYKKDKNILYSDLADASYQYKNWAWYSEPKKLNRAVWSEPYIDEGGGDILMTTYSTPIRRKQDTAFAGVATADIDLSWLNQIIKQIKIGKTGYGFILSRNDIVIAHPNQSINMTKLNENQVNPDNWKKYVESKSKASTVYINTLCDRSDPGKGMCQLAIETLGTTGWKVVIVLPEDELSADVNALTTKISLIAAAGLILLFFIVVFISRKLTTPLGRLADATKEIGAGYLDTDIPKPARKDEIGILTEDFDLMRNALKTYIEEVQEATAKQQKLESEIQIAKDIQMSMIPHNGNAYIDNDRYQLFAFLKAARSVGGDLYYFEQTDSNLSFIIGDVSDKGVPAALFMAKTVTLYTRALKENLSPADTFTMMNDILAQNNDACMFVTALCGTIDLQTGSIVMANAGHMNPVLHSTDSTVEQEINGATALGLMEGIDYPEVAFKLSKDTSLIMYTDGISEAHDTANNQYTDEKLITFIKTNANNRVDDTGNKIIEDVESFAAGTEQFDDITLLLIHYS